MEVQFDVDLPLIHKIHEFSIYVIKGINAYLNYQ